MTILLPPPLDYSVYSTLLCLVQECRFATTHQLARLTASRYKSLRVAHRQTARHLNRLEEQGYIIQMPRSIGGRQRGSGPKVWICSAKGNRTVTGHGRRPRVKEHSTSFVEHTLAVTETRVAVMQLATEDELEAQIIGEPECWRSFLTAHGHTTTLRPDLYVRLRSPEQEFFAFIEADCASENPARVLRKCLHYDAYFRTGLEQRSHGVFPIVIWIVPDQRRLTQLTRYIREDPGLIQDMFQIITLTALPDTIRRGLELIPDTKP